MFRSNILQVAYKNLLGWKAHFDNSIELPADLTTSDTGEYYQEKNPALRLDYIKATLSTGQDLDKYLQDKVESGVNAIFNDILQYRQVNSYGKTLLEQAQLLNRHSWVGDKIMNTKRFVGFQIRVKTLTGLQAVIEEVGLQLEGGQTVTLYLFHSTKEDPLTTFDITTVDGSQKWKKAALNLNSMLSEEYGGGVFVLGYYQDDLEFSAINYTSFNWDRGECGGCNNSHYGVWKSIRDHFFVYPLYVPFGNYTTGKMFDLAKAEFSNNQSWGLNLKFTVRCDLTDFFAQNRFAFKNLLALKVTHLILNDMKFSQETSYVEENLKMMIIRDLEGDKETNHLNISQQYSRELKAVNFNIQGINNRCLDCSKEESFQPTFGVV